MFTKREFIIKLGENVRNIKSSKNITIITLAFNADIAFSQLSRVELGKISTSVFTLFRYLNHLRSNEKILFHNNFEICDV